MTKKKFREGVANNLFTSRNCSLRIIALQLCVNSCHVVQIVISLKKVILLNFILFECDTLVIRHRNLLDIFLLEQEQNFLPICIWSCIQISVNYLQQVTNPAYNLRLVHSNWVLTSRNKPLTSSSFHLFQYSSSLQDLSN